MADIPGDKATSQRFGALAWIAVGFAVLLGVAKALIWSKGIVNSEVVGYAFSGAVIPMAIAYAIAGRKKVRNGNRFAFWLALISVFFLLLELSQRR